jgi:hypothetical protein
MVIVGRLLLTWDIIESLSRETKTVLSELGITYKPRSSWTVVPLYMILQEKHYLLNQEYYHETLKSQQ